MRKYDPEDYWYVGSKGLLQEPQSVEGLGSSTSSTKHKNTGIKNTTLRKYEPEDYWHVGFKGLLQEPHPVEVEVADKSRKIVADTPIKRNYIQDLLL